MSDSKPHAFPAGIITAILTPMDRNLNADLNLLTSHAQELLQQGSDGILYLGTTGEANSFSVRERKAIISHLANSGFPADQAMTGTGCCSVPETIELTRFALDHGISHVLMLPPFYYKQVTDEGLFTFYANVIESIADARLRVYLYHIPQNTGIRFSHNLIARLIDEFSETLAGMKDSAGDWEYTHAVIQAFPGLRVYSGSEDLLLRNLQAGGPGAISATANVTAAHAKRVVDAFHTGGEAESLQETLTELRKVFAGQPLTGALKAVLADFTRNPQWLHLRPPNTIPAEASILKLLAEYRHATGK